MIYGYDESNLEKKEVYTKNETDDLLDDKANDDEVVHKSGDTMTGALVNSAGVTGTPIVSNGNLFIRNSGALYMNDGANEHTILSNSTSNVLVNYGGRTIKHLGLYSVNGVGAPIAGFNLSDSYQIVTRNYSLTMSSVGSFTNSVAISAPSGYTPVALAGFNSNNQDVTFYAVYLNGTNVTFSYHVASALGATVSLAFKVLCLKTS